MDEIRNGYGDILRVTTQPHPVVYNAFQRFLEKYAGSKVQIASHEITLFLLQEIEQMLNLDEDGIVLFDQAVTAGLLVPGGIDFAEDRGQLYRVVDTSASVG